MLRGSWRWAAICLLACGAAWAEEPRVVRENIEWLDVWIPDSNAHDLPRVLLIGDSITRGYGKEVESQLKGQAYVARLATSKSLGDPSLLGEVALVLGQAKFDVVHVNNGMHGWGYTEEEYRRDYPKLLDAIRQAAPHAKLILATTTPVVEKENPDKASPKNERINARNKVVQTLAAEHKLPVDDLHKLVSEHPDYLSKDGVHSAPAGVAAEAKQVAQSVLDVLKHNQ